MAASSRFTAAVLLQLKSSPADFADTKRLLVPQQSQVAHSNAKRVPVVLVGRLVVLALILALWQWAAMAKVGRPVLVSSPEKVWIELQLMIQSGALWVNFLATMYAVLVAFFIGSLSGAVAGLTLGLMPRLESVLSPFLNALNSMPRIALAPVFIVYWGIGAEAKIALAVSLTFFIMLANATSGIRSADPELVRVVQGYGAGKVRQVLMVYLPSAVPAIFAGLRLSLVYSLLGVVASEVIASRDGLGQMIQFNSSIFNMGGVYAILLVLALVGSVLNIGMSKIESLLLKWQDANPQAKRSEK